VDATDLRASLLASLRDGDAAAPPPEAKEPAQRKRAGAGDQTGPQRGEPEELGFDRIVWNFPCIAGEGGADSQLKEMEDNKALMSSFFREAPAVLLPSGEIHVVHKTKPPFSHWGIENLAQEAGLELVGRVVFDRSNYPSYDNRKVTSGSGKFPTWDAVTYIWRVPEVPAKRSSKGSNATGEKGSNAAGEKGSNATGEKGSNATGKKGSNATGGPPPPTLAFPGMLPPASKAAVPKAGCPLLARLSSIARHGLPSAQKPGSRALAGACTLDGPGPHSLRTPRGEVEQVHARGGMVQLSESMLDAVCHLLILK